ncbi:MAG: PhnD/SsuA/transferrin family substrate-binding protein [Rhodobacter sp.]|jgi:ABC-type phosphate/phosphonate transport system substrate-binding protein|nr:PhnD/SsuA/transferrin family substrate-binding protein [Rhodobacter sp.]MBK8440154.1 PhnD/SsuA/transferrin family substrate-binding protein [Rhodobacter sp.]
MIASLGMYDFGPAMAANDRLWAGIRDRLRAAGQPAPDALTRGEAAFWPAWMDPALVLSQTCGYPYRARLHGKVALVATPDYGLPGCPPGHYHSVLVARADDPRDRIEAFDAAPMAFNEELSQSGWAAPAQHLIGLGLTPCPVLRTGGHRLSAQAVAAGRADLAGLDALTWAMLQGQEPAAKALKVVGQTAPTPALPFIAGQGADRAALLPALRGAIAALSPADRTTLHLQGLVEIPAAAYLAVPTPPPPVHFGWSQVSD